MASSAATRESAYDALAPYYDAFTAHPNYPNWVRSLEVLARSHGLSGRRVLDVGCGTGSSIEPLLDLGYEATGCDVSAGMLAEAARKLPAEVRLLQADVCAMPALGTFDLVWGVNDTVNYLQDVDELEVAFTRVAEALEPDGRFVFDVNTLHTYRTAYAASEVREADDVVMAWVGSGIDDPALGDVLEARIELFERDTRLDLWRRSTSRHRQRCHAFGELRGALDAADLSVLAVYGLTADAAIEPTVEDGRHTKAIFVVAPDPSERR